MLEGHCNCKSVTVKVPSVSEPILCYCSNCRRAGSGLCSANLFLKTSDIEILDPHNALKSYRDGNTKSGETITRNFCGTCGSPIFTASSDDAPQVIVKAGLFADEQLAPPTISVFEDSKAPWIQIQKQ